MNGNNTLDVEQLRAVVNRLFDHVINSRNIKKLTFSQEFYWNIPSESLYVMDAQPSEFNVGSLVDDWEFVQSVLREGSEPVAYQFTEIAPLLRYLGENIAEVTSGN